MRPLKTKGSDLEHNFGHGKKHLASLLAAMNMLVLLTHTFRAFCDGHSYTRILWRGNLTSLVVPVSIFTTRTKGLKPDFKRTEGAT